MGFVESDMVELKAEMVSDICKEIIAFANTRGGSLYIGIADDGTVVGIDDADHLILQLNSKVRDSIKPDLTMFVRYDIKAIEEKKVLLVTVQRGTDRPYYLSGKGLKPTGVFVRNGTSSDPATETAIRKMIKETDGDSFEAMRSLEQSLTFKSAEAQFVKREIPFDSSKMQTLGMLSMDGIYTNLAMLLSDQCNSTIKAATFLGSDKSNFQDRREFSGSLFEQLEDLYDYLNLRNQTKATFSGLYRTDNRDYPEEAIREALLNSVVHRDYSFGASTLISVYDDRMEFVSIGGLPTGIELDDILLGLSVCRNPKLAAVFYRLELIEAYGTGIPKIMNAYDEYEMKPKIEVTNNAFKITLPNCNVEKKDVLLYEGTGNYEIRILKFIKLRGQAARSDVETLLGVSQATANRILKQMIKDGLIHQEGRGKTTRYKCM